MRQTIKILTKDSPRWLLIEAEIIGDIFGVHESIMNYDKNHGAFKLYSVTVIPSGLMIFQSHSYNNCIMFAKQVSLLDCEPVKIMMRDIGMHCSGGYCIEQAEGFDFAAFRKIRQRWDD